MESLVLSFLTSITDTFGVVNGLIATGSVVILYLIYALFKKRLPVVLISKKTLDLAIKNVSMNEHAIVSLNDYYTLERENSIIRNIREMKTAMNVLFIRKIMGAFDDGAIAGEEKTEEYITARNKKTQDITNTVDSIAQELFIIFKRLVKENGFTKVDGDTSKCDVLDSYCKNNESLIWDCINTTTQLRYLYYPEDNVQYLLNDDSDPELSLMKEKIREKFRLMMEDILKNTIKQTNKISELMNNNSLTLTSL